MEHPVYLGNEMTNFDEIWHNNSSLPSRSQGDVIVVNITFFMIFGVFDPSLLTLWINCCLKKSYLSICDEAFLHSVVIASITITNSEGLMHQLLCYM